MAGATRPLRAGRAGVEEAPVTPEARAWTLAFLESFKAQVEHALSVAAAAAEQAVAKLPQASEGSTALARVEPNSNGFDRREMEWRVLETFAAHCRQRRRFFVSENGAEPAGEPTLTDEIREAIRKAIKEYDRAYLGADQRELWRRLSKARAAGIGLFLSPFHTGRDERAEGRKFLEPWRPWKVQRGKASPVEAFAQLYFEAKAAQQAAGKGE